MSLDQKLIDSICDEAEQLEEDGHEDAWELACRRNGLNAQEGHTLLTQVFMNSVKVMDA